MSVGRGRREGGAVILVSLFCDFGGAWREEGRAGHQIEFCTFSRHCQVFLNHLGVIFL